MLLVAAMASADASALTMNLTVPNPVDCSETFKAVATLSEGASLMRADYYVDRYLFDTKNIGMGSDHSEGTFGPGDDWYKSKLSPGTHQLNVRVYRGADEVGRESKEFTVGGRRCEPAASTTTAPAPATTAPQSACYGNSDCAPPNAGEPYCVGDNVVETLTWGECVNPGTPQAACTDRSDNSTLEACFPQKRCVQGSCEPLDTTSTSSTSTTSTTESTSTTTTIEPTETTQPAQTTTTRPVVLQRTNTRLDRIIDLLEQVLRIVFFWK
jgi:hypothetical protein